MKTIERPKYWFQIKVSKYMKVQWRIENGYTTFTKDTVL